ncbi:MAG: hypothetical protein ACXQTD_07435 [Candidatus Syntropharchaeia archaeon]
MKMKITREMVRKAKRAEGILDEIERLKEEKTMIEARIRELQKKYDELGIMITG